MAIVTLGIDLAKNVFQLHGVDIQGKKLLSKRVSRKKLLEEMAQLPICLIGMEACGSAHYWARKLTQMGHAVKLMSPQFVKPYVKTNKNDCNDAEAICEAVTRPTMRFVPVKTVQQQEVKLLHTVRSKLVKDKVALSNQIRGLLLEYGIAIPQGDTHLRAALSDLNVYHQSDLTEQTKIIFSELYTELLNLINRIADYTKKIKKLAEEDENSQKLMTVPGIGEITATAMIATVGNFHTFKNGRGLSAWLGLVPVQKSSGQKILLLGISKRGDNYLRTLLIHGARAVVNQVEKKTDKTSLWIKKLLERQGFNKTVVAVANKNARIAWSIMTKGTSYQTEYNFC